MLKLDLKKWLELIRDFDLMPKLLGMDISAIFLGQTYGDCTILPDMEIMDYFRLCRDPDTKEKMGRYMLNTEQSTWRKLGMIEDRMRVENALRELLAELEGEGE